MNNLVPSLNDEEIKKYKEYNEVMQYYILNHKQEVINNTLPEEDKDKLFAAFYEAEKMCILNVFKDPEVIKKKIEKLMEVRNTGFAIMEFNAPREK